MGPSLGPVAGVDDILMKTMMCLYGGFIDQNTREAGSGSSEERM